MLRHAEDAKDRMLSNAAPPKPDAATEAAGADELATDSSSRTGVDVRLRLNRSYDDSCRSDVDRGIKSHDEEIMFDWLGIFD